MTVKFSYETVKDIFEMEGYTLISKIYVRSGKKLEVVCPKGHPWFVTLNCFTSQKSRCPTCLDKASYTVESVRAILKRDGYTLSDISYSNMKQKLNMVCRNGHAVSTSLDNYIGHGSGCNECRGIKRYTIDDISNILRKEGYRLITTNYKNAHQKLNVFCSAGHETTLTMNGFLSAKARCQHCAHNRPHSLASIKEFVEKEGYLLKSEEYDPQGKILLICPKNHPYETTFYNFKGHGRRCPKCTLKGSSIAEREIFALVSEIYPGTIKKRFYNDPNNKKRYLELDIYVPELGKSIEYDGSYYHSFEYMRKAKNENLWSDSAIITYHEDKDLYFLSIGIKILHIKEEDWDLDKQSCIKRCLDFLSQ